MTETCHVADQHCVGQWGVRGECFACGMPVCSRCSSRRKWFTYGRKRICNSCQEENDGNRKLVWRRIRWLAGEFDSFEQFMNYCQSRRPTHKFWHGAPDKPNVHIFQRSKDLLWQCEIRHNKIVNEAIGTSPKEAYAAALILGSK